MGAIFMVRYLEHMLNVNIVCLRNWAWSDEHNGDDDNLHMQLPLLPEQEEECELTKQEVMREA